MVAVGDEEVVWVGWKILRVAWGESGWLVGSLKLWLDGRLDSMLMKRRSGSGRKSYLSIYFSLLIVLSELLSPYEAQIVSNLILISSNEASPTYDCAS